MSETLFGIVGAVSGISGLIFGLVTLFRNKKSDDASEGKQDGILLTQIGYMQAGIDDIKKDNREFREDVQKLHDQVVRTEESAKQAHRRIDKLEKYHTPN